MAPVKTKNRGIAASVSTRKFAIRRLPQPARRVREQGVDHAGFRDEVAAQCLGSAVFACDLVEQPLEFGDVAVDRLLEAAVGAVFSRDLVEGLLARGRVEPLRKSLALASLVSIP